MGRKGRNIYREPSGKRQRPSARERTDAHSVYFIGAGNGATKVGYARRPADRVGELQVGAYADLAIQAVIRAQDRLDARRMEAELHAKLKAAGRHIRGEWFYLTLDEIQKLASKYMQVIEG